MSSILNPIATTGVLLLILVLPARAAAEGTFGYRVIRAPLASPQPPAAPTDQRPTQQQLQEMQSCLSAAGISIPTPPPLTAKERSALESCQGEAGNPSQFISCAVASGVPTPPPPPPLGASQVQAMASCAQKYGPPPLAAGAP
jgi:hypothetical protein